MTHDLAANSEESSAAVGDLGQQIEHIVEMLEGLHSLVVGKGGEPLNHNSTSVQSAGFAKSLSGGKQKALPMGEDF